MFVYFLLALAIVVTDQISKIYTVATLDLHEVYTIIPDILSFTYIQNDGAAWSILEGQMIFFYLITSIVIITLVYYLVKHYKESQLFSIALAFLLGGAIGNFIDRILYQYVIDMIRVDFISFPIFNIADSALTIGVGLMIIHLIIDEIQERRKGHYE
ncbi:signal peptidase II [Lacticigenium naphthae]|uniref:signal peptidase II n=1 Tax=Lacticigenium naphthae TaxID=515351 RepID=UPI0003FF370F|nr:signal peptidase II [Lacticigenium naphthae]